MPLDQIFSKIIEQATAEAAAITETATKEVRRIISDGEKEAQLHKERAIAQYRETEEFLLRKKLTAQKLAARKHILQVKKDVMDECFKEAVQQLVNLNKNDYKKLISGMLAAISVKDAAELIFSIKDKPLINPGYVRSANPDLNVKKISFSEDIKAGFIFKTDKIRIDNSLETIVASMREKLEPEVGKILFEE